MRLFLLLLTGVCLFAIGQGAARAQESPTPTPITGNVWVSLDSVSSQLTAPSGSYSYSPAISADGNYVAFQTMASLPRDGDINDIEDIFRRDIAGATSVLVSVAMDGEQSNNRSYSPDMTADGATIVFESFASNLVTGDANNSSDIFVRDLTAATTTRITSATDGSDANGASFRPVVSADGAFIAYCSRATNLVAGTTATGVASAYVFERATSTTTKLPVDGDCARTAINDNGSLIAVAAVSGGTSHVSTVDRASGAATQLTTTADGSSGLSALAVSGDARIVAFDSLATNLVSGDSNRSRDVFVETLADKTVTRASVRTSGTQLPGDSGSSGVSMTADGRYVVFGTQANQVVPGDSNAREDVFRRDLQTNETTIVSVNLNDRPANDSSYAPDVNADGTIVAFASHAANIVAGDNNRQPDIFIRAANFPSSNGDAGPEESGAPEDDPSQLTATAKDEGLQPIAYIGGAAGVFVVLLVLGTLVLGRRGKA